MTRLTRTQAAIIGAYTGILVGPFEDLHAYVEKLLGRPVLTHELASPTISDEIKRLAEPDFLNLCAEGVTK